MKKKEVKMKKKLRFQDISLDNEEKRIQFLRDEKADNTAVFLNEKGNFILAEFDPYIDECTIYQGRKGIVMTNLMAATFLREMEEDGKAEFLSSLHTSEEFDFSGKA